MYAHHQLMKRGEREVARILRNESCRPGGESQLNDFLNFLLDPDKPLDDADRLRWCRSLISGGVSFDEYSKTVSMYDDASVCGLVWTSDFVAYRCRTCGISPCMSLCSECFHAADHTGHDFNMFRSQAGGACDCGDIAVMRPIGFCVKHGPNKRNSQSIPEELVTMPSMMMGRLIIRLVQHLREFSPVEMHGSYSVSMPDGDVFIDFLQELSDMGAVMKTIIAKTITDCQLYANFMNVDDADPSSYEYRSHSQHRAAVESMTRITVPPEFQDVDMLTRPLTHTSLLDELFFWAVKYEFPQKLASFLLSLLPNEDFKELFTVTFVRHYSCITGALTNVLDKSRMANRVVHISVQLLSPPLLAYKMVVEHKLLHVVLASLRHMINTVLTVDSNLESESNHQVVDCSQPLLVEHSYWPIISDLINLLAHRQVAFYFMTDKKLFTFWAKIVSCFQGMNLNVRELKQHVVYEPESYYAAFSAELEICASIMWSLIAHLNDKSTFCYTKNVLDVLLKTLKEWFSATRTSRFTVPYNLQMSFHYPLHRYFAVFVNNAVNVQEADLDEVLPAISTLHLLMIHPLHLMVCFNEIYAGMWVRNGHQILGQAMTYLQSHFCNSTVDADIYLLQLISAQLDPDYIVHTVLDRFRVLNLMTFGRSPTNVRSRHPYREQEHEMPMLESALAFLSILIGERTNLGLPLSSVIAREMTTLLAISDRTHSQLMDAMPEKCGLTSVSKDYEPTLAQVADFKTPIFGAGGTMQQGKYVLKSSVWLDGYNPLHVLLRAVNRRDVQTSMDRFTESVKLSGLYKGSGNPWPPFCIPVMPNGPYVGINKLLHCRSMHAVLFTLLYKALYQKSYPEAIVYYAIHLLELAISIPDPDATRKKVTIADKQLDRQFSHWFAADCIFNNVSVVIQNVIVEESNSPSSEMLVSSSAVLPVAVDEPDDDYDDVEVDEEDEEDADVITEDLVAVMSPEIDTDALLIIPAVPPTSIATTPMSGSPVLGIVPALEGVGELTTAEDDTGIRAGQRSCGATANFGSVSTVEVAVNESMLSLLLQLYKRFVPSKTQGSYQFLHSEACESLKCRVGCAGFFIKKVIDKLCMESTSCLETVNSLCQCYATVDDQLAAEQSAQPDDLDERLNHGVLCRAQESQAAPGEAHERICEKAKKFMEKVVTSSDMEVDSSPNDPVSELATEREYDCCICNQTTQSTAEHLIGLVALLQPTNLLAHRKRKREAPVLVVSDVPMAKHDAPFAKEFTRRFRSLAADFDETSCVLSVNIGWEGGVYVQTCGHYLHLDCKKLYISALKSQMQLSHGLRVDDGEFWCPLCRQLSNTVLPILPDDVNDSASPCDLQRDMVAIVADLLLKPAALTQTQTVKKSLELVINDLTSATLPNHRMLVANEMNAFMFVCSILRTNLELEIDMHGGSSCLQSSSGFVSRKSCIPFLFQILNANFKMMLQGLQGELWSNITGFTAEKESRSLTVYHKEVPLLLRDTTCLFLQLVLSLPRPITKGVYQFIVRSLYNVQLVQFIVSLTRQFTNDERSSWQSMSHPPTCQDLQLLTSRVIEAFDREPMSPQEDYSFETGLRAICNEAWSPVNAQLALVEHVLPFLRVAGLLQSHIFDEELPSMSEHNNDNELTLLATYTGLVGQENSADTSRVHGAISNVLGSAPVEMWCQHLARCLSEQAQGSRSRMLLTMNPTWYPAKLHELPRLYEQIFDFYRKRACSTCGKVPKNPALCLVCGQLLCYKDDCCKHGSRLECAQHSITCGSGSAVLLIVNSTVIIIIRGQRATIWGSVYLDAHGEEDRELKRGRPLQLSVDRYQVLQNLWTSHGFDSTCKQWIFHSNQL